MRLGLFSVVGMKNNKICVIFIILNMNPDLALSAATSKAEESKNRFEECQREYDAAMADLEAARAAAARAAADGKGGRRRPSKKRATPRRRSSKARKSRKSRSTRRK